MMNLQSGTSFTFTASNYLRKQYELFVSSFHPFSLYIGTIYRSNTPGHPSFLQLNLQENMTKTG